MNKVKRTLNYIVVCALALRGAISMEPLWFNSGIVEGLVIGIPVLIFNGLYFFGKSNSNEGKTNN